MGTSGVPETDNGADVGFTDFSEFSVAVGLPAGITAFGICGGESPTTEEIRNDVSEGNYFFMDGHDVQAWGYGYDAFDAIISGGELLARIWVSFAATSRRGIGPAMNLSGLVTQPCGSPDFDGEGGGTFLRAGVDIESAGSVNNDGSSSLPVNGADFQEAFQNGAWAWQRVRITELGGGFNAWEITTWYGGILDEPASLDGSNASQSRLITGAIPGALGWMMAQFGDVNEQRIAYLSYTSDPALASPPVPFVEPGTSGIPEIKNGTCIGFTDFSEFSVGAGIPPEFTEYGDGNPSPSTNEILNDLVEGNYFQMFNQGFNSWGFGYDNFDGLIDLAGGELLARIFIDIPVNGRKLLGPAANMLGVGAGALDNWIGAAHRLDPDENSGVYSLNNGSASNTIQVVNPEGFRDDKWAWVRVRRKQNGTDPSTHDDFEITIWFGKIADEPAMPDGEAIHIARTVTWAADAIGWAMPGNAGAENTQKIAFLSFSCDPDLEEPPVPFEPEVPDGTSGIPYTENGTCVGFTDFSEFSVGAGLPSGITVFGDGVNSPNTVAIANDAIEGNYFSMDDHALLESWAFGLDSFFGEAEFGEWLARVFYNPDQDNRRTIGPSWSIEGATDLTLRMASGSLSRPGDNIPQLDGVISIDGTSFVPHNAHDIQEAEQIGQWMWLRIRRTQNAGTPANDDWQSTGWYGAIEDEPAVIDGQSLDQVTTQRGLLALGWSGVEFTSTNEQRIAYLAFTCDPDLAPPPEPGPLPEFPETVRPMRVTALWSAGALRDKGPAGLIQTRFTKAAGWMFTLTYPLFSMRNLDHQELTTFLYTAWQRGQIFTAKHPLQPGSGLRPNGLGTAGVLINGIQNVGDESITTDGWPNSTANVARAGDAIKIDGDDGVYILSATASSNGSGEATLEINPPLRIVPADNASVQTTDVPFRVTISDRSQLERSRHPLNAQGPSITLMEALN